MRESVECHVAGQHVRAGHLDAIDPRDESVVGRRAEVQLSDSRLIRDHECLSEKYARIIELHVGERRSVERAPAEERRLGQGFGRSRQRRVQADGLAPSPRCVRLYGGQGLDGVHAPSCDLARQCL